MHKIRAVSAHTVMLGLCLASSALATANNSPLKKEVPDVVGRSMMLGHSNPNTLLHVAVSMPYADPAGMQAFVDSVSNPKSANYRQFITPEEVGARFGISDDKVAAVSSYLKSQGFKINLVAKNHLSILADCTIGQAEKAFGTTINNYQVNDPHEPGNPMYYSFSTALHAPDAIAPYILDVSGLESFTKPHRYALTCTQARTLYNLAPMYSAGTQGQGRKIGISNWDGYRLNNTSLYYSHFGLPTPVGGVLSNIHVVSVEGGNGQVGSVGAEGDLDIQMEAGMAPLADIYIYDNDGVNDLIGTLTKEANDNLVDVISESYGWNISGTTITSAHNEHLSMSAEGITYMAASGDSGTSLEPYSYPDYEPEVLSVGGTVATVDSSGNRTGEVAWSGGGGGWSTNTASINVRPSWQTGNGVPTNNHRLVPDVGFHASSSTGAYQFYLNGSLSSAYVGTSFASPVVAGSLGVAEQAIVAAVGGTGRFGRIQDLLYSQNGDPTIWFDIVSGSNGTLPDGTTSSAHAGWDYCDGWGAINWQAFVNSQTTSAGNNFSISATPSSQTVTTGGSTSYTVNTAVTSGTAETVSLSISGVPSGASASFSPTSVTAGGSSTLSVNSGSAAAGTYTLTITGTAASATHSTTVSLTINPVATPDFTISASPSSRSVKRGNGTTYTVSVGSVGGFTGSVALSVSGLPSGVTGSLSPSSISTSGNSTLTISTSRTSPRGTFILTISGVSGSTTHTTTVSLQLH